MPTAAPGPALCPVGAGPLILRREDRLHCRVRQACRTGPSGTNRTTPRRLPGHCSSVQLAQAQIRDRSHSLQATSDGLTCPGRSQAVATLGRAPLWRVGETPLLRPSPLQPGICQHSGQRRRPGASSSVRPEEPRSDTCVVPKEREVLGRMSRERFAAPRLLPEKMSLRAEKKEVSAVTIRRVGPDAPSATDWAAVRSLDPAGQPGALRARSELPPAQPPTSWAPRAPEGQGGSDLSLGQPG